MEAAGALGRGGLSALLEAIREAVRARSRVFWLVAGLTSLAALLRFATLGLQAYHHDEIVTASRVLSGGLADAIEAVWDSESAPPLYYALAWLWTQVTGTGEVGLRSLSALAGAATVPVAFLLAAELRGRRAGIAAAALVAVNPMLLWYAQEARAYALLVLLTAVAALFFVRALRPGASRDVALWGVFSGLALATHYFALFPVALQALWLWRRHGRAVWPGLRIVAVAGLLLAPLALHQMMAGRAEWIGGRSLGHRLWEAAATFAIGETGDIVARAESLLPALLPLLAIVAALGLLVARGDRDERRAGGIVLALAAITVAVPLALALAVPGKDYVLARNLIPALVPLLVAVAIGATARRAGRAGVAAGAALFAYSLGFSLWASLAPGMHRPDWEGVASRLGAPEAPRAMVSWKLGHASLRYYLDSGAYQTTPAEGYPWFVHEIDFVSNGPAPPVPAAALGPRFRQVEHARVGRLHLRRYEMPGDDLAHLRLRRVAKADLGFRSNGVLLDGIGPP